MRWPATRQRSNLRVPGTIAGPGLESCRVRFCFRPHTVENAVRRSLSFVVITSALFATAAALAAGANRDSKGEGLRTGIVNSGSFLPEVSSPTSQQCASIDPARVIAGCTAFLRTSPPRITMSAAYTQRGLAHEARGEYDLALADYDQ